MSNRNKDHQEAHKDPSESKKKAEAQAATSDEHAQADAAEQMQTEQPTYETLEESKTGGSLHKTEHRADPERMSRRQPGLSSTSAERSEDLDKRPARGEGAGAHGVGSETAAEQPSRGESRGIAEESGEALSDATEAPTRGESTKAHGSDGSAEELNYAGFSRSDAVEGTSSQSTRTTGIDKSGDVTRGESSQEPSARGGFIEPDDRTLDSSSRH